MKKKLLTATLIITLLLAACGRQGSLTPSDKGAPHETLQTSTSNSEKEQVGDNTDGQRDNKANGDVPKAQENGLSIAYSKEIIYTYVNDGSVYQTIRNDYNDQGWVIRVTIFDNLGNFTSAQIYTYDKNGNMTERTSLDGDQQPTGQKTLIFFSEDGKQLKDEYYKNGSISFTIEYIYDENGLLTKEIKTNSGGEPFDYALYTYDANGSLIKEERYLLSSTKTPITTEYVCDEEGRVLIRRTEASGLNYNTTRYEYTYNEDGSYKMDCIPESANESITGTIVYDAKGNLVSEQDETFVTTLTDVK